MLIVFGAAEASCDGLLFLVRAFGTGDSKLERPSQALALLTELTAVSSSKASFPESSKTECCHNAW